MAAANLEKVLLTALIVFLTVSADLLAATSLENAAITPISLAGSDIVYDSTRNVLYMSVPSAAGFPYGNSVVTINPATGQIIHTTGPQLNSRSTTTSFDEVVDADELGEEFTLIEAQRNIDLPSYRTVVQEAGPDL